MDILKHVSLPTSVSWSWLFILLRRCGFHCFVLTLQCWRDTIIPPPLSSLYCVLLCGWGGVWTWQSRKHSGKENPKLWGRVGGCRLASAPGGVWGKQRQSSKDESRNGKGAPRHSKGQDPTQCSGPIFSKHSSCYPTIQMLCKWNHLKPLLKGANHPGLPPCTCGSFPNMVGFWTMVQSVNLINIENLTQQYWTVTAQVKEL